MWGSPGDGRHYRAAIHAKARIAPWLFDRPTLMRRMRVMPQSGFRYLESSQPLITPDLRDKVLARNPVTPASTTTASGGIVNQQQRVVALVPSLRHMLVSIRQHN